MKLVQINAFCGNGSTGKICVAISKELTAQGIENYILYTSEQSDYPLGKKYMSCLDVKFQAMQSRIFGNYGFNSTFATKKLLMILRDIQPDVVHLHNLHSHNCNLEMLFRYLKENHIKVFWTFHDCWAFTGYCPHYDMAGCDKWKRSCEKCPQKRKFSWFFDKSKQIFEKKKRLLEGLNLTIITPSYWLADQVKQSFLHKYKTIVIHNGVDLELFSPKKGNLYQEIKKINKYIVLGVAYDWSNRKGLDVFCELAERLDDRYQIVLVGTNDATDKILPDSIISIHRTQNQRELAEIYTAADVFVNPTREEVLGLTNIEALACGTPVVTFDTGGSPECLNENCGIVVPKNDVIAMMYAIEEICTGHKFSKGKKFVYVDKFDSNVTYNIYRKIYEDDRGNNK